MTPNNTPPSPDPRNLITAHLLDDLSPADTETLAAWIRASPANADTFARAATLHRLTGDKLRGNAAYLSLTPAARPSYFIRSRPWIITSAAALLLLAATAALVLRTSAKPELIDRQVNAVWASPSSTSPTRKLLSGIISLSPNPATTVIIQGPAEFTFTDNTVQLLSGRAVFKTHKASPYTLQAGANATPTTLAPSDHPAEFGVAVSDTGVASVRVFTGSLTATLPTRTGSPLTRTLTAGTEQTLSSTPSPTSPTPLPFVRELDLRLMTWQPDATSPAARWANVARTALADPSLLLYTAAPFATDNTTALASGTAALPDLALDPRLAIPVPGRLGNDTSLQFSRTGQGLPAHLPGTYTEMTLSAWVKLYPEDLRKLRHRGLIMSDGWANDGQVHWQLKGNGFRVTFFDQGKSETARFPATSDALFDGQWHLLTSVISMRRGPGLTPTVTHFADGVLLSRQDISADAPSKVQLGNFTIGGWVPADGDDDPDRHLNGTLADLMIFSRALTPAEVQDLHRLGAPQR